MVVDGFITGCINVKDGLLSASWAGFKDLHGALAPSLLELPMTKATVKAMDVLGRTQNGHDKQLGFDVSKRLKM